MRFFCSLLFVFFLCSSCFSDIAPAAPASPSRASAPSSPKNTATSSKKSTTKRAGKAKNAVARAGATADTADAEGLKDRAARDTPLSLRGNSPQFSRTVTACLFRGNEWMLPHKTPAEAAAALEELRPSFVIGTLFLTPDEPVSEETAAILNEVRFRLQSDNGITGFDLVLDLRRFSSEETLRSFLCEAMDKLTAECWTFIGMEEVMRSRPKLAEAAKAEVRARGMRVGAVIDGTSAVEDLDYAVVSYNGGSNLADRVKRAGAGKDAKDNRIRIPVLIWPGTESLVSGNAFALNKTPAQRRLIVKEASEKQGGNVWFAYPVFGPSADADRSYDALRDEFMMDTVKRCMEASNPVVPAVPIPRHVL